MKQHLGFDNRERANNGLRLPGSKNRVIAASITALFTLMLASCGGEPQDSANSAEADGELNESVYTPADEAFGSISQALGGGTTRTDLKASVELNPGLWGTWQATRYCPEGAFVVGYRMRVEKSQGDGDDTGLNAVEVTCMDRGGRISYASAHDGSFGDWKPSAFCSAGSYVTGGEMRFESSRGGSDDTAGNDVRFKCANNSTVTASGGASWGIWLAAKTCPVNTAACGIAVRYESNQGDGDDTALNAVKLACCTAPSSPMTLRVTDTVMDGIVARTFSPDSGAFKAPLILVEGFDQDNTTTVDKIIRDELPPDMIKTLTDLGYTVSIVDLSKNWESIKVNARRVGAFANTIWGQSQKATPIKFVGASMGGLITTTTTALRLNPSALGEANPGWTFNVDHLTTLDSPHSGAYIPQAIFHVVSRFQGWETKDLFNALTSAAVKEMLMIPWDSSYDTAQAAFQQYYTKALSVVRNSDVRFVAISNGSWTGATQNAGWTSRALNIAWNSKGFDYNGEADLYTQPTPGQNVARIRFDLAGPIDETKFYNAYAGNWPIVENSPGGYGTQWAALGRALRGGPSVKFPQSSFVPTWSAIGMPMSKWMALPVAQRENMSALVAARGSLIGTDLVPFDRIIVGNTNTKHTKLEGSLANGFIEEMIGAVAPMCDGTPGNWDGCRGTGCSVCTEKTGSYPFYFTNHPNCASNPTCGGVFATCNAKCPVPTDADKSPLPGTCDGTVGQWQGCRGNGCLACTDALVGFPKYFANHPRCVANTTCGGVFGTCNDNCPTPTNADR